MVIYKCKRCGDVLVVIDNTEKSRNEKREFKKKHHEERGHGWMRQVVKRGKNA